MLFDAILLDPLNVFLYTWTFLEILQREETNRILKKLYYWYRVLSIWLMPLSFFGLFTCEVLVKGKIAHVEAENYSLSRQKEIENLTNLLSGTERTLGYLTTVSNCLSCVILALMVRLANKTTQRVEDEVGAEFSVRIKEKRKLNSFVTVMHVFLILSYTVTAFLHETNFTQTNTIVHWKVYSTLLFFTASQDIFLSFMIILIVDDSAVPTLFHSKDRVYAI